MGKNSQDINILQMNIVISFSLIHTVPGRERGSNENLNGLISQYILKVETFQVYRSAN